jgi:hypothetical protein
MSLREDLEALGEAADALKVALTDEARRLYYRVYARVVQVIAACNIPR